MQFDKEPLWASDFSSADWEFIKNFLLSSGSLKEMAQVYEITYPTVRLRLDRLIAKINLNTQREDSYIDLIKNLTLENKLELETAKLLLAKYQENQSDS